MLGPINVRVSHTIQANLKRAKIAKKIAFAERGLTDALSPPLLDKHLRTMLSVQG